MGVFHGPFRYSLNTKTRFCPEKAHFLHLSVFAEQHRVVAGFRVAILPAFAFGHTDLPFWHGGFAAVDQQAVLTGLQGPLADFCGLRDADGLADGLGKYPARPARLAPAARHFGGRIGFHAGQLPSIGIESAGKQTGSRAS